MPVGGGGKPAGGYHAGKKGSYGCNGYPTVSADGTVHGCHPTAAAAAAQARAIWAATSKADWAGSAFDPQAVTMDKKDYSTGARRAMAARGVAMPDGSFPIANETDLRNAIQSVGRASNYEAAKRHIIRRARALGLERLLPEDWTK